MIQFWNWLCGNILPAMCTLQFVFQANLWFLWFDTIVLRLELNRCKLADQCLGCIIQTPTTGYLELVIWKMLGWIIGWSIFFPSLTIRRERKKAAQSWTQTEYIDQCYKYRKTEKVISLWIHRTSFTRVDSNTHSISEKNDLLLTN